MHRALVLLALVHLGCFDPKIANGGFTCDPADDPPCPSGFSCVGHRCIQGVAPIVVDKTGAAYTGQHTDPGLALPSDCPDEALEPNDGPLPPAGEPINVKVVPDTNTAKVTKMAICPKGPNAATHNHDVDYFRVDASAGGAVSLMAEVYYDITYGDLDVAIVDAAGDQLAADGSATSNACAAASIGPGVYYVVVVGAGGVDVNNYDLRVRTFTHPTSCDGGPADMAMAASD